ncbi:phage integrase SAM-like domain-containing protein [Pseudomonas sp. ZM23]|uniref:Phage integrase SAM-like domain-containing protein n=1 Tax=Pseudomonas triclosanedens TaxID=2961893 RepID=A0ABY6ZY61_9PSED|nr:site-specific integrase [Pseudomonas triclosanedens]MCP8467356.1 phage integrase SAM-like domain-containing protein [Pseudomonas triclosanedens]MCP8469944.1 phage integrase SAM-like domain-containing protein [Pseudomonas triclosanedens]MCP8478745.1 phage integrase SAM-like domain-containing protein [Pseudomonas triclosanedens]WAI49271.1 phage integrase SAM-like domain-containing protein [Pseudomonas triclosanedens]
MAQPFKHPQSGVFYLRRRVPDELRPILGHEYKRSLKTRDPAEAKARFAAEWGKSEEAFSIAKAQASGAQALTVRDAQQLAARWYRQELAKMESSGEFRSYLVPDIVESWETPHGPEEHQDVLSIRQALEVDLWPSEDLRTPDGETDYEQVCLPHIRHALHSEHILLPPPQSPIRLALVDAFRSHLLKLSEIAKQRYDGDWMAKAGVLEHEPLSVGVQKGSKTSTLLECFEAYARAKILDDGDNRSTRKTLDEFRSSIRRFIELFGDMETSHISRGTVQDYRSKLAELPVKTAGAGKLTAQQLIEKAKANALPRLSPATIRNRLRALSAILGYAVRMGWIQENPVEASGVAKAASKAAGGRVAQRRKDYSQAELNALFSSPIFAGTDWKRPRADYGKAWYWLPLLMYYTGARREELAQLAVADVKQDDAGIHYLSILATSDETPSAHGTSKELRTVKTDSSRRRIPLHPDLIELGLLDYAKALPPTGQLFPLLKASPAGFYGTNWGKAWGRYLRDIASVQSPASPSHGFRHTFKTLCRQVGIPEDVHDAITGHSDGSVSRDYGSMPLQRMAEELAKLPSAPTPLYKALQGT